MIFNANSFVSRHWYVCSRKYLIFEHHYKRTNLCYLFEFSFLFVTSNDTENIWRKQIIMYISILSLKGTINFLDIPLLDQFYN